MSVPDLLIGIYGYLYSGALIHFIGHGMGARYQVISCGIAAVILVLYPIFGVRLFHHLDYGLLSLPVISVVVFNFAAFISWRTNGREFRATWQGARHYNRAHGNWIDHLLSFFVVNVFLWWPILIAALFG